MQGPIDHPVVGRVGADQIAVDTDGDGLVDVIHDIPAPILQGSGFDLDFRLSPSQQVLFTVRSPSGVAPVCNGDSANVLVYFHRLEAPPATTALASAVCLRAPLAIGPLFYDPQPAAPIRTAIVVAAAEATATRQPVLWVDLVNGGFNLDGNSYQAGVLSSPGGIQFAADGRAAFVDHGSGTASRRFAMIDLCRSRVAGVAAGAVSTGALGSGIAQAWTVALGGGVVQAEVRLNGTPQIPTRINLDDCSSQPPPTRSLSMELEGTGQGRVGSTPTGIDCGPDCQGVFQDQQVVQLDAIPESGSSFVGWFGDCSGSATPLQITLTADRACTARFTRPTADLRVSMAATPDPVVAGERLVLTVTAFNDGPEAASSVTVALDLPDGTSFTGTSPGGLCFGSGTLVNCSIGGLGIGSSQAFSVEADVSPALRGDLQAQATISGQPFDADGSNNQASVAVEVIARADLSLNKTVAPDPGGAGGLVVYSLDVTNAGPSTATGVRLEDVLPPGLSPLANDPALGCRTSPIPPGASAQFKFMARIDEAVPPGTTLTNQARISADEYDPDLGNNQAAVDLVVAAGATPPAGTFVRLVESDAARPGGGTFSTFFRASHDSGVTAFYHFDGNDPFNGSGHWLAVEDTLLPLADGTGQAPGGVAGYTLFRTDEPSLDGFSATFSALLDGGGWGVFRYDGCAISRLFDDSQDDLILAPNFLDAAAGQVAFVSGGDLYRWDGTSLATLVNESTPLPSGSGNGLFSGVFSLAFDGGPVFFIATGGSLPPAAPVEKGVYAFSDGIVTPIATTSTPIPGGVGTFADFDSTGMTLSADGGDVVFRGVDGNDNRGIYAYIDGVLRRVVDHQTPIPGGTGNFEYLGESFSSTASISEPSLSNGRVVFAGKNSDADASQLSLFLWDGSTIEPVLRSGDSVAGGVVNSVGLGRRGLDGNRLVMTAEMIEPGNSFRRVILLTELPEPALFSDRFEVESR
ncbi:MAG: DUF11 domain-containing protein [Wenzhouxiangella sp.]|nr:DUF11 domain-containing protein [Wenzhouxiangella sp.]